jgi:hypothetical protein
MKHRTKNGQEIPISNLTDGHLVNIIRLHKRLAREGLRIEKGGKECNGSMWYERYVVDGQDALLYLNHNSYLEEAKKRGINLEINNEAQ